MADRELQDVPISAMIEQSLRDEIAEVAKKGERSFSAEVRRALRFHVMAERSTEDPRDAA